MDRQGLPVSGANIPLVPCVSSNVAAWGYQDNTLAVQFKSSGGIYHYADVPPERVAALSDPDTSVGSFIGGIRHEFAGVLQKPVVDDE